IALACDFIFAEDSARFGLPEIALGVFPPTASALRPRRCAGARATSAILTGRLQPAAEWLRFGLLEAVVPDGMLQASVDRWFEATLAGKSAAALHHATAAARLGLRRHGGALVAAA